MMTLMSWMVRLKVFVVKVGGTLVNCERKENNYFLTKIVDFLDDFEKVFFKVK